MSVLDIWPRSFTAPPKTYAELERQYFVTDDALPPGVVAFVPPGQPLVQVDMQAFLSGAGQRAFTLSHGVALITGVRYPPPMTTIYPTPFIDTEAALPDSEELAAMYEAKALEMENQAADGAGSPQQQIGLRAGASTFRRMAAEIRGRLGK